MFHQIGGKVILRIFLKLHFFFGRERNDVEKGGIVILGIFLKLHFFSRRERNPWRTAHNCGLCVSSDNARAQAEPYHIMSPIHQITILILEYEGSCIIYNQ
jgi:hypothetical protein